MLEGNNVNLSVVEREDLPLLAEWLSDPELRGQYTDIRQQSRAEVEKKYDKLSPDDKWFFIEKKDGSKVGWISHHPVQGRMTIAYAVIPGERKKGYCTEAVGIMVDYLFLSKNIVRIQARTLERNLGSQKVLEKAGFKKEGILRKFSFIGGIWHDDVILSILREEWKEPKILTKR